jgi:hypothetical protein
MTAGLGGQSHELLDEIPGTERRHKEESLMVAWLGRKKE